MRLLLDTCVWGKARVELETAGHDVLWAGDWDHDPGDEEIMSRAFREGHILVTLDKDFGELAIVRNVKHAGIVRLVNLSARQQAQACLRALERYGDELAAGGIATVETERIRIRPAQQDQ